MLLIPLITIYKLPYVKTIVYSTIFLAHKCACHLTFNIKIIIYGTKWPVKDSSTICTQHFRTVIRQIFNLSINLISNKLMSINHWRFSPPRFSDVTVSRAANPIKAVRLAQYAVRVVAARRAQARHVLRISRATMPLLTVSTHSVVLVLSRGGPCHCQIKET